MPSYTIKVPNDDEGEDLGEYEADYLPRVGDQLVLWHQRVTAVTHEAWSDPPGIKFPGRRRVDTTVWLGEEHAAPTLYCDCSEEQRLKYGVESDGRCANCGHVRRT